MPPDALLDLRPPPVTPDLFRDAMSRLGAPVTLVTTDGAAGRHGLTASAVTSVSDAPPTVLVCLNRTNRSHQAFLANGVVGLSLLSGGHEDLAAAFASSRRSTEEKFAAGTWHTDATGAPLFGDALATLDCSIGAIHAAGSHDVLFCTVRAIRLHPQGGTGLAWFDRRFHHLPPAPQTGPTPSRHP
ncbi:flavin reductase [Gluconacetobacter takamatsuzukensis]|uniref:Flavin reductase n=1 Tax=Gluconacetobacter takamatsuzukensis TaxID=1286190 RepID=A0A7W4KF54_9PROT|nr:flavin reductase [Gluconacetobacter takamatsuzukensis]MBB2205821.1 flavin reductase [Gluconacetobacter takamatsuzukensis]